MAKRRPSGDGMVRKREDGRWEGRIVVGHKENGESIFRYISAKSQKALMKKLHQSIEAYRDVDLSEDSRMPLGEWLDRWLEEYVSPVVRESTLKGYRQYIECYIKPRLGDRPVCKVTAADVQALYREVQKNGRKTEHPEYGYALSGSTVRSLHGVLHQAMDAAVRERLTARNPTEDVTLPKKKTAAKQILNNEQLERFMEEIKKDPVWCDFFYTELTTGMRRGEICGLMWSDFDGKKGTLTVRRTLHQRKGGGVTTGETKTGKGRRTITLPPSTAQLLRERQKRSCSQWIFPNPLRPEDPVNPGRAYSRLKTLLKSAGLPGIRFHDLRHPNVKSKTKIFYPLFLNNHSKIRAHRRVPSHHYSLLQKFFGKSDLSVCCLRIIAHTDGRFKLGVLTYASKASGYPFGFPDAPCWGSPKPRTGRFASSRTRLTAWLHASHDQQGESDVTTSGG